MKTIIAEISTLVVTGIGITGMIGILFDFPDLRDWKFTYQMALPTAVAFLFSGVAANITIQLTKEQKENK